MNSRARGLRTRTRVGRGVPLSVVVFAVLAALVVAPAIALAAAQTHEPGTEASYPSAYVPGTYLTNGSDFVSAADWDSAETIRIEMSEFKFTPSDITLEAGKPYILELVTVGAVKHEFTASDFFASAAWRKVESGESEVKATYFKEVEVFPGKQADLYLVPIEPGTYELVCEIEGHFEAGMFGTITVTGSAPTSPAPVYKSISQGPWVADGAARVDAADWDTMQTVRIDEDEFSFAPQQTVLEVNQPYKLEFVNIGAVKHESTAPEFFQTVAFRKAEDASGEFKAPTLLEVETFSGKQTDLYLIPTAAGTFDLVCEIEGHFEAGMFGTIVVQAASQAATPPPAQGATPPPAAPVPPASGNAGIAAIGGNAAPATTMILLLSLAVVLVAGARALTSRWPRR